MPNNLRTVQYSFINHMSPAAKNLRAERDRVAYGTVERYLLDTMEMRRVHTSRDREFYISENNGAVILHTEYPGLSNSTINHTRVRHATIHSFNDSSAKVGKAFEDIVARVNQLDEAKLLDLSALGLKRFPDPADIEVEPGEFD